MLTLLLAFPLAAAQSVSSVTAERVHLGDGRVLDTATVTIANGKIVAIVPGGAPSVAGAQLTPGLVDAYTFLGVSAQTVEHSREVTAGHRVASTLRLDDPAFARAAADGVTTAYVSPDSLNVIGGFGAIAKTAGGRPADLFAAAGSAGRIVADAAGLRIVIGVDAYYDNRTPNGEFTTSSHARRPTTRMGSVWEIRNAFYSALAYREERKAGAPANADFDALLAAIDGTVPVRVLARRHHDAQTALRLQQEFGWQRLILEEATECYLVRDLLAASGVQVVTGPAADVRARAIARGPSLEDLRFWADPPAVCCEHVHEDNPYFEPLDEDYGRVTLTPALRDLFLSAVPRSELAATGFAVGRMQEAQSSTPALAALLSAAGVPVVIGGAESYDFAGSEASAIHQARTAARWGLPPADALAMVTSRPAAMLGLGDRVGRLAAGLDADLVLWSGDPLDSASTPLLVVVDGQVVIDHRPQN
jgi:imidazolonepropionase-like amidohydrolase